MRVLGLLLLIMLSVGCVGTTAQRGADKDRSSALTYEWPNPFSAGTVISFELPDSCNVHAEIYSLKGEMIAALGDRQLGGGHIDLVWDGLTDADTLARPGVYSCRLYLCDSVVTRKVTIPK